MHIGGQSWVVNSIEGSAGGDNEVFIEYVSQIIIIYFFLGSTRKDGGLQVPAIGRVSKAVRGQTG